MSSERQGLLSSSSNSHRLSLPYTNSLLPHPQQQPADTRSWCRFQTACACILATEMFERIAFYSVAGNLVLFLNEEPYLWDSYNAAGALFIFMGISYITSLFSGWFADSFMGKFKTISASFVIYLAGYVFMPILAPNSGMPKNIHDLPAICGVASSNNSVPIQNISRTSSVVDHVNKHYSHSVYQNDSLKPWLDDDTPTENMFQENCSWLVFIVLSALAIGTGCVKANIAPFGGDQLRNESAESRRAFFNWFYWFTNLGAFVALGPIAYVQQEKSFYYGYMAAGVCLLAAAISFIAGYCCYIRRPAGGSTLNNICKVCLCSIKGRSRRASDALVPVNTNQPKPGFLDYAKIRYGGRFRDSTVNDVKTLFKVLVVFTSLVPYWMVYFQMETTFLIQGLHMRLSFTANVQHNSTNIEHPQVVAAWLSLFDVVFLIVLIPVMDRLVYPYLDKAGYHFSMAKRIMLGMLFGLGSILVAGGVETDRLSVFWPNKTDPFTNASVMQKIGESYYQAADMSVFWQIPQYALLGVSEVFASVAGLEFAYSKAPRSMKGIIMGFFFFTLGIGSFLGTGTVFAFVDVWFFAADHGNINCRVRCATDHNRICQACHLDYYFYFLAGLQLLGLIGFIIAVRLLNFGKDEESTPQRTPRRLIFRDITASDNVEPLAAHSNSYGSASTPRQVQHS